MTDEMVPPSLSHAREQTTKGWVEFKASFAGLSEEDLTRPGVNGSWSVKDVVAHVSAWEAEALRVVSDALAGRTDYPRFDDAAVEAFNTATYEARKDLPLDQVFAEADRVHERLVHLLGEIPEARFQGDERLQRWIIANTYGHYGEHLPDLVAFREVLEFM